MEFFCIASVHVITRQ